MKKKISPLALGAGALAVLCAVYAGTALYGRQAEKKKEEAAQAGKIYITDMEAVSEISYENSGGFLTFVKEGDKWYYKDDRDFPLLQYMLTSLEEEASKLLAVRRLENGDDPAQYGLTKPERKITIVSEAGETETILIGSPVTDEPDSDYYAMKEGGGVAYTIAASLPKDLSMGLYDLIDLEEFPGIQGENVTSISISQGGETRNYVKERTDDEGNISWYRGATSSNADKLEDPSVPNALADAVSLLIVERCQDYKADKAGLEKYGLLEPSVVLSYTYEKDGEKGTVRLEIGNEDETKMNYYTRKDDSTAVNLISKELLDPCLNDKGISAAP